MSRLEDRLRTSLRDVEDSVEVAPDAWQQNQARLRAARAARRGRVLAVAATVAALALVSLGVVLSDRLGSPDSAPPASGGAATDGPFADQNLLGPPVDLGPIRVEGQDATWRAAISDTTGDGPMLCDEIVGTSSGSGSCAAREEGADRESVAVDWFVASRNGTLRTLLVGLDDRVERLDIHSSDGHRARAELHTVDEFDDVRVMGHWVVGRDRIPQRIVAYDADNQVLQAVDLPSRAGDGWLPQRAACAGDPVGTWSDVDPTTGVSIDVGTSDALVRVDGQEPQCVSLRRTALGGWVDTKTGWVAVVVAPEVLNVWVRQGDESLGGESTDVEGAPARAIVLPVAGPVAELEAHGPASQVLDSAFVNQPRSP